VPARQAVMGNSQLAQFAHIGFERFKEVRPACSELACAVLQRELDRPQVVHAFPLLAVVISSLAENLKEDVGRQGLLTCGHTNLVGSLVRLVRTGHFKISETLSLLFMFIHD